MVTLAYFLRQPHLREIVSSNLRKAGYKVIVDGEYVLTNANGITVDKAKRGITKRGIK